jgi:hypothetical protein
MSDVGNAIESAIREMNLSHYVYQAMTVIGESACQHARPSAVFRPWIFIDGDQWCALYGENLQDGVAGFGSSPHRATYDFDLNWDAQIKSPDRGPPHE